MREAYELTATRREKVGKGASRALRRNGQIPAIIYGDKKPPVPIVLPYKEMFQRLHAGGFLTNRAVIDVEGEKIQVIPKAFELDPVRDFLVHVDFLRIGENTLVTLSIPARFVNEDAAPGIKRGGVLNVVRYEIEVECPANAIPAEIVCDLTGLEINDSLHISAVSLPENVTPTIRDRDFTIATIAAPAGMNEQAAAQGDGEDE